MRMGEREWVEDKETESEIEIDREREEGEGGRKENKAWKLHEGERD